MVICWTTSIVCSLSDKEISDVGAYALSEGLQVNHSIQELEWVQLPYSGYIGEGGVEKFSQNHNSLYYRNLSRVKFLWTPIFFRFYPRVNTCKTAGPSPRFAWVHISICVGSRIITVHYDFGDWFGWSSPNATVEVVIQLKVEFPMELMGRGCSRNRKLGVHKCLRKQLE